MSAICVVGLAACSLRWQMYIMIGIVFPGLTLCSILSYRRESNRSAMPLRKGAYGKTFKRLINPLACAVVFFLVYALTNSSWEDQSISFFTITIVAEGAVTATVVLLALIWFVWKKELSIEKLYITMFPVLATLFFLGNLLRDISPLILTFIGNVCMSFMSMMMIFVCLKISKKYSVSCQVVYGVFAGSVYLAKLPEAFTASYALSSGLWAGCV